MGKKSGPKAPDLSALAAATEKAAELGYKTSQEQLAWAREMWGQTKDLLTPVLDTQQQIMANNLQTAMEDRARYENLYQPLEENLIGEFQAYDSPERRAMRVGQAQAQVRATQDAERENALARLEGYGIDPSQTRSAALDRNVRAQEAAQQAAAGNIERSNVENTGRALRAEAINIGRGMPSQVAQSYGLSLAAGNNAMQNQFGAVQSGASSMGTGLQWGGYGLNATGQQANILNSGYQNKLAGYEAQGNPMELLAMGGGAAMGMMGLNRGGEVAPQLADSTPTGRDTVPAALTPGEFVVPKEAVSFYGTDKLSKMVAKARQAQGIPDAPAQPAVTGTPVRLNAGGMVPDDVDMMLAEQYDRNQGMASSAETFRLNQQVKREAEQAKMQQAIQTSALAGKAVKGKVGAAAAAKEPKTQALPEPTTTGPAQVQPSGATTWAAGADTAIMGPAAGVSPAPSVPATRTAPKAGKAASGLIGFFNKI